MAKSGKKQVRKTGDGTKAQKKAPQQVGKIVKGGGSGKKGIGKKKKKGKRRSKGDPVSTATGTVVDEQIDLFLPGAITVHWQRTYSHADAGFDTPFGRSGWTHDHHQWIEITKDRILHHDEGGVVTPYPMLVNDGEVFLRSARATLRLHAGVFELYSLDRRQTREFARMIEHGVHRLRAIRDNYGNRVELDYQADRLVRIRDTADRELRIEHDQHGHIVLVGVWARGAAQEAIRYEYSAEGDLTTVCDAIGAISRYAYDGLHRMTRNTLPNGVGFNYAYDPTHGRCKKTWGDGNLHAVEFTYDLEARTTTTHGERQPHVYTWSDSGALLSESTFDGQELTAFVYDDDMFLVASKNAAGDTVAYVHDERGNVIKEIDPLGLETMIEYQADLPVRRSTGEGVQTFAYDAQGGLIAITYPHGQAFQLDRDGAGHVVAVYGPMGLVSRLEWDAEHNLASETDARGARTAWTYDALGRPQTQTDGLGRTTRLTYDAVGNVVRIDHPDGSHQSYDYDLLGNVVRVVDPCGQVTRRTFEGTGVLATFTGPDDQTWAFHYDNHERLVEVVNPRAERHEYRYDSAGRVVEERTLDGRLLKYQYDRGSRLSRIDYPDGSFRSFVFGRGGLLVEEGAPDAQITWKHDAFGRITEGILDEGSDPVIFRTDYDQYGRIVAEHQGGASILYAYDSSGRRASRTLPSGETTTFHYDELSNPIGLEHQGQRIALQRDILGREVRRHVFGAGLDFVFEYDVNDDLVSQAVYASAPGSAAHRLLCQRSYQYDSVGRVTTEQDAHWGTSSFRYDEMGQLLTSAGPLRESFEHDVTGSLEGALVEVQRGQALPPGQQSNGALWDLRPGNLLARTGDHEYEYDARHRRIKQSDRRTGATVEYLWDARDRLRRVVFSDGSRVDYTYDAAGRRVRKQRLPAPPARITDPSDPSHDTSYYYDGNVLVAEMDSERGPRSFVQEPNTLAPLLHTERGRTYYYVNDHHGTPRELIDEDGVIVYRVRSTGFGEVASVDEHTVNTPLRAVGHYFDEETGLTCTRYRHWDGRTGRWLSPDPLGLLGGTNLFGFEGCPINAVDVFGLEVQPFTGTQYNPDGTITRDYYQYLRQRTPNTEIGNEFNTTGVDPVYSFTSPNTLAADHIVPMKEIVTMPGFNQLTPQEALEVLNLRANFWSLDSSVNSSKGGRPISRWIERGGYAKRGSMTPRRAAMLRERDKAARAAIKEAIRAKLAARGIKVK